MKNFPIEHEGKTYWISRAIGVAGYIFCYKDELLVLANKRGKGTPDFQGYWNCPCGYLDFDETTAQACSREIQEETNLYINPNTLVLYNVEDDPSANKQNVTFRFYSFCTNDCYESQKIYAKGEEEDEVDDVKWIPVSQLNDYKWAFNQKRTIIDIVVNKLSYWISPELKLKLIKDRNT